MSTTPMTPAEWRKALKAEGVDFTEDPGWTTHSRDKATGKTFGPVRMVLIHHTAGRDSLAFIRRGSTSLPGPLAHTYLPKSGRAVMVSRGRANHAGPMAVNAYASFRDEKASHPKPSKASGTVDGNDVAYGIEIENLGNGSDPYPAAQYDAAVRWAAAICRHHGWTAQSVAGHKETSVEGKIDPSFDMDRFRRDVQARLDDDEKGTTMSYKDVWDQDVAPAPDRSPTKAKNPTWKPISFLREIYDLAHEIRDLVREVRDAQRKAQP